MGKGSNTAKRVRVQRVKRETQLPEATIPSETMFSFASQVAQYPLFGVEGISEDMVPLDHVLAGLVRCLLWRDHNGMCRGILNYYPSGVPPFEKRGSANLYVDPMWQRRGIATELFREADSRWDIDLTEQRYSPEGRALAIKLATDRGYAAPREWSVSGSGPKSTEQVAEDVS